MGNLTTGYFHIQKDLTLKPTLQGKILIPKLYKRKWKTGRYT